MAGKTKDMSKVKRKSSGSYILHAHVLCRYFDDKK